MGENRVTTYTGSHLGQEGLLAQLGSWQMPFAKVIDLCQVGLLLLCFHVYHWVTFLPKNPYTKVSILSQSTVNIFKACISLILWQFHTCIFIIFALHYLLSSIPTHSLLTPPKRSLLVSCLCMDVYLCLCLYVCLCLCVSVYAGVTKNGPTRIVCMSVIERIINWSMVGPPKKTTPSPETSERKIYSLSFHKDPDLLLISPKGPMWLQQQISPPCENTILFLFLKHLQTSALIYLNKSSSLLAHRQCPWGKGPLHIFNLL